ncbi:MAG: thioredoxin-disulfide reductase [Dehalococcoidales bacterium]|nr:thioredoxin-disulfide reductase [Dehalococcoidales bacterium]
MAQRPQEYDVIIIGGGPAGLSAGIYTARARLTSLLIEKGLIGGQIVNTERLDNYPGFPDGISGTKLTELMHQQATKYGMETAVAEVTGLKLKDGQKVVETTGGSFTARALIIAGGCHRQKLGVAGEEEFTGKGVSYCATCDGAFFRELPVAVVGGGNAAITEALHLTRFATKVTVIHRRDQLRATKILQEKALSEPKIDFRWDSVVEKIEGKDLVSSLKLRNVKTGKESGLSVSGVFVSIGFIPNTDYLKGVLPLAENGAIVTNGLMETEVAGIYAAGDIRQGSPRQVIIACGDGATAAIQATKFLA